MDDRSATTGDDNFVDVVLVKLRHDSVDEVSAKAIQAKYGFSSTCACDVANPNLFNPPDHHIFIYLCFFLCYYNKSLWIFEGSNRAIGFPLEDNCRAVFYE